MQRPGQGDLGGCGREPARHRGDHAAGAGRGRGRHRKPRDEGDAPVLAVPEQVLGRAVGEVVAVLDAGDRGDLLGLGELADADLGQAHVPHFSLVLKQS